MAYSFNGTSQYLSTPDNDPPFPNFPMTIAARFYEVGAASATRRIVAFGRNSSVIPQGLGTAFSAYRLSLSVVDDASVTGGATIASPAYNANEWNFSGGTFTTTLRKVFQNVNTATDGTTLGTVSGVVRFAIGAIWRNIITQYFNGYVAEVAVWSVDLTDDEMRSLRVGFKAHRVRPQSLVYYSPVVRDLQDLRQNRTITNNNTATVVEHPRVY
jgi:hypothetical protein